MIGCPTTHHGRRTAAVVAAVLGSLQLCFAQPLDVPPAEALRRADEQVYRPERYLRSLDVVLEATATNVHPDHAVPEGLVMRGTYEPLFTPERWARQGHTHRRTAFSTNQPEYAPPPALLEELNDLVSSFLIPLLPVPALSDWVVHLHADERDGNLRKMSFSGKPGTAGGWIPPLAENPVLWLDALGRVRRLEFSGTEGKPIRLDFEWEPSPIPGLYRLAGLTQRMNRSQSEISLRRYRFDYGSFSGRELPETLRLETEFPEGVREWAVEMRVSDYALKAGERVAEDSREMSGAAELLARAAARTLRWDVFLKSASFGLELEIASSPSGLPFPKGSRLKATLSAFLVFDPNSEAGGLVEGCRLVTLEVDRSAHDATPEIAKMLEREVGRMLETIFDPVAGFSETPGRIEEFQREATKSKVLLSRNSSQGPVRAELFLEEDRLAGRRLTRATGSESFSYDWEGDEKTGKLRLKSMRQQPGSAESIWEFDYQVVSDVTVPSSVRITRSQAGPMQPGELRLRFTECRLEPR